MIRGGPSLLKGLLAGLWSGVVLLLLSTGPVESPLRSGRALRLSLMALAPQGWAFFTRDAREPVDRVFRETGATWSLETDANSSARHLFGASRAARALNVELTALLADAPRDRWTACRSTLETCLRDPALVAVTVPNPSLTRRLCGTFAVERQPPVPWAWSRSASRIHMPSRVLRLDVRCDDAS